MEAIYKFHFDCGRQGELTGLFIADSDKITELIESERVIYFGEALGKHSEVFGPIEDADLTLVTTDIKVIAVIKHYELENGYNPLNYDNVDEDDLEDIEDED